MAEPRRLERLSGQDLLMLWADDFGCWTRLRMRRWPPSRPGRQPR